jgi:hypothetical protein
MPGETFGVPSGIGNGFASLLPMSTLQGSFPENGDCSSIAFIGMKAGALHSYPPVAHFPPVTLSVSDDADTVATLPGLSDDDMRI